jgi:hypothetical protein
VHTRRDGAGVVAVENAGVDKIMKMSDEHALGDVGDAAAQFGGSHGPVK